MIGHVLTAAYLLALLSAFAFMLREVLRRPAVYVVSPEQRTDEALALWRWWWTREAFHRAVQAMPPRRPWPGDYEAYVQARTHIARQIAEVLPESYEIKEEA